MENQVMGPGLECRIIKAYNLQRFCETAWGLRERDA
jgi:hypothetical protein